MVTDLLVFGLKPPKLLDSINWCKSIYFFLDLFLFVAGPSSGYCIDVMHVVIVFEFYSLAFVAFSFLVAFWML